jgi:hypothetical protein
VRRVLLTLLLWTSGATARADDEWAARWADPSQPEAGARTHDGFMARGGLGLGLASLQERSVVELVGSTGGRGVERLRTDVQGLAIAFNLDLGFALAEGLTLFARLSELAVPDPGLERDGMSLQEPGDSTRSPLMVGPGFSLFLMPWNLQASLAIGLALGGGGQYDGDTSLGDEGVGLNVDVGKEWWLDAQWGMGVVGRLWLHTTWATESASESRETDALCVAVLLSTTYQ